MIAVRTSILALFLLLTASPSWSQDFYVYGGGTRDAQSHAETFAWGLAYMRDVGEHVTASFTYLNEGHLPNHHRDGYTPQVWVRTNVISPRLSLSAGIGPYLYFDTASGRGQDDYNTHGLGGIFSLAATWRTENRWRFQLRANWIGATNSLDTLTLAAGIGYQLDALPSAGSRTTAPPPTERTSNEITLFMGESTLNRLDSRHTAAEAVEYRRGLTRYIDWTIGFLNEGSSVPLERYGITSQVWLLHPFFDEHLALGIGAGPYIAYDEYRGRHGSTTVNGLIGLTASYRFSPHWAVRLTWDRVATNYNQDTDVLLGGLTYRF